jgi:predicted PurR-regulated permease PerM
MTSNLVNLSNLSNLGFASFQISNFAVVLVSSVTLGFSVYALLDGESVRDFTDHIGKNEIQEFAKLALMMSAMISNCVGGQKLCTSTKYKGLANSTRRCFGASRFHSFYFAPFSS